MIRQPVFLGLGGLAWAGLIGLPILTHAPNRLLSGHAIGLAGLPGEAAVVLAVAAAALLAAALVKPDRLALWLALTASAALPPVYFWAAGAAAHLLAATEPDMARTSIGSGGWLVVAVGYLSLAEAVRRLDLRPLTRAVVMAVSAAALAALALGGLLDDLALAREWQAKREVFADALLRHGEIVLAALIPTLLIGIPLGVLAHRHARLRGSLLAVLGLIQTIPSIALFGLLMTPLSALGHAVPWLGDLGIRGVGLTPAVIALALYALLPIVRNTAEGLAAVPAPIIDSARGQGLTPGQIFRLVEIPLALPVLLAGLRITLVQTVGLAAVAALIGAGGLGALMFQGLFANAQDLILLGALPVVVLAVTVDLTFRLAVAGLRKGAA